MIDKQQVLDTPIRLITAERAVADRRGARRGGIAHGRPDAHVIPRLERSLTAGRLGLTARKRDGLEGLDPVVGLLITEEPVDVSAADASIDVSGDDHCQDDSERDDCAAHFR